MKKFIGTKIIEAEPFKKDGADGYKVIYDNPNNTKYESWSPKNVFEEAYLELNTNEKKVKETICDIFHDANVNAKTFIPQSYVWAFLKVCEDYNITIGKK